MIPVYFMNVYCLFLAGNERRAKEAGEGVVLRCLRLALFLLVREAIVFARSLPSYARLPSSPALLPIYPDMCIMQK